MSTHKALSFCLCLFFVLSLIGIDSKKPFILSLIISLVSCYWLYRGLTRKD